MKGKRIFSLLLVVSAFFLITATTFAKDDQIPTPAGDIYVQDFAHVLNKAEKAELIKMGRNLEDQTTAQIAVLTVQSIGNQTIEDYANKAFRQYGIGNKEKNNGVLLVLSMKERKVRIEVGYGLEGRIPDGKAGRILDEYAIPFLKNQQPNRAIVETYKALAKEVLAEYGNSQQKGENEGKEIPAWLIFLVVIVLVFLDFRFFGGTLTYLFLSIFTRGGNGGPKSGGGGSSGGGGAGRGW